MANRGNTFEKLFSTLRAGSSFVKLARKAVLSLARKFLVRKLNESPGLEGTIGGLELHLLRNAVVLRDVYIAKSSGGKKVTEAFIPEIVLRFRWRELWEGTLVGRVQIQAPRIELTAEQGNDRDGKAPADALLALCRESRRFIPFHLTSIDVSDGLIEYRNHFASPPFRLAVEKVALHAANVTNIPALDPSYEAQVALEGETTGHGKIFLRLTLPSLSDALTFDLRVGLSHVNLVDLNDFLRACAKFDLKRGVCSVYAEFKVADGEYHGYIQPHFQNLDVFAWEKEQGKGFLQICRHAAMALMATLFKSQPRDELALNIPISGSFADADVDVWSAVGSLLKNAFGRSLLPGFENDSSRGRTAPRPNFTLWGKK